MTDEPSLESRYRVAVEAADIGIWTWSRASGRIAWDATARRIMGLGEDARYDLLDLEALVVAEDRTIVRDALSGAMATGSDGTIDFQARIDRMGAPHWVAVYGHLEAVGGAVERVCGAVRDVSESRLAEIETDRSEARLAAIVSIAADAIISVDGAHRIRLFNGGAEAIFGYGADEIVGQPLGTLLPERLRTGHDAHMKMFGATGNVGRAMGERSEIFALRKSGEEFAAEASISHITIDGESIFTVVLRDVSERKRVLDMLALSRDELERRVAERTAELKAEMERREETQAQLVRTQRMEAFGQLTGGIAHDFNNLLTVITGNLELLEMRLEDERSRGLLKRASEAAEMGARLTSRLLTFSRRRQFSPAPLNLNEQVMGMVDLLRRTLGEDIDLNARLAPKLWTVRADPSEIENAVLNLAINARDAMPRGGRLVLETANVVVEGGEVGAIERLEAGCYVRLSVSDTGTGMTPEIVGHAFEPFFTTKQPGKGTGLGLSTIYGFAEQSGGTATIYSEVGIGTTVNLYLPQVDDEVTAEVRDLNAELPMGRGETVLLVEDNPDVRDVTQKRLAALGYVVVEAVNGPDALGRMAELGHVDLVFSDVIMSGGLSGFDVAREIRTRWPATRLLLASGYPDDMLRLQEIQIPELRILRKPYSRAELARVMREVLGG
jgi:PAS domain S-box-containing protein